MKLTKTIHLYIKNLKLGASSALLRLFQDSFQLLLTVPEFWKKFSVKLVIQFFVNIKYLVLSKEAKITVKS